MAAAGIETKASFDKIRYASVWEDADILCDALAPSCKGGRILSIASSGDNVLALLTIDPKEIVAADISPAQLACVELRISAFRHLDYFGLLAFLGVTETINRKEVYDTLKDDLSPEARDYWDRHPREIEEGIIHAGRFERYLKIFGCHILPWIHSKEKREELLKPKSHTDRVEFYDNVWDTYLWRLLFRVFFSKMMMGKAGRDPAFFDHVQGSVSDRILHRTRHALTELQPNINPYLHYIAKGNYSLEALPKYLRAEYKETITSRLNRITLVRAPVQDTGAGMFDGFNLSDIFEYMDEKEFINCYGALLSQANPGARLVYWNLLVPREVPATFEPRIKTNPEISEVLHWRDKTWFYQAFHVDEVLS